MVWQARPCIERTVRGSIPLASTYFSGLGSSRFGSGGLNGEHLYCLPRGLRVNLWRDPHDWRRK